MPPTPPALIEADGLCLGDAIGARQVPELKEVGLRDAAGRTTAIAGPWGCGSASLLLLAGPDRLTALAPHVVTARTESLLRETRAQRDGPAPAWRWLSKIEQSTTLSE